MGKTDKVVIAFDVDGTLRRAGPGMGESPVPSEGIRSLLVILAGMSNTEIVVWSGAGELYARMTARELGISRYADRYAAKGAEAADITVDDEACTLGKVNLRL
jgi:hypothetical protein